MFDADFAFATRPRVPPQLQSEGMVFRPAPELGEWMREVFITDGSPLWNAEHQHLQLAQIAVLWTNVPLARHGNDVAAMTELPKAQGNKWAKGKFDQQMTEWFGPVNFAFLLTFYGPTCHELTDAQFCALCEHELLHCGQKMRDGEPVEDEDGNPQFTIRGHDVEEFVSVVRRYGAGNAAGKTAELVYAASLTPLVADVDIRRCCGNCIK